MGRGEEGEGGVMMDVPQVPPHCATKLKTCEPVWKISVVALSNLWPSNLPLREYSIKRKIFISLYLFYIFFDSSKICLETDNFSANMKESVSLYNLVESVALQFTIS